MKEIVLRKKEKIVDSYQENICSDKQRHIPCERCEHEIYFDDEDMHVGAFGAYYVYCPHCGEESIIADKDFELTDTNIEFPIHFFHTSSNDKKVYRIDDDETITREIRNLVKEVESDPEINYRSMEWGDTMIIVINCEDEIRVFVTKNYYESTILK